MKQPTFCGRELLSLSVIEAARAGDPLAVERVLRYYEGYINKLCTRTLYDDCGQLHVCVDEYMKLFTVDHYPSDSFTFSSHGCDLHIDNELVAEAFATLPSMEQSILILHCVMELADGEIGALMGMSRSAVQRHRTKTLSELRKQLKALMPKGG